MPPPGDLNPGTEPRFPAFQVILLLSEQLEALKGIKEPSKRCDKLERKMKTTYGEQTQLWLTFKL